MIAYKDITIKKKFIVLAVYFTAGAVLCKLLFLYWNYYTKDILLPYVPEDVTYAVQIKEALGFQKTFQLDDGSLQSLYSEIEKNFYGEIDFVKKIVPQIDKQFIFAKRENNSVLILRIKDSKKIKKILKNFEKYFVDEKTVVVFSGEGAHINAEIKNKSFPVVNMYKPIKIFLRPNSVFHFFETDLLEKKLSRGVNTNLVQTYFDQFLQKDFEYEIYTLKKIHSENFMSSQTLFVKTRKI